MTDYLTDAQNDIKTYFETHDIPIYFYQCLLGEFVKMFGAKFLIPDDDYSYREQLELYLNNFGGTGGWNLAFKEACDQCGIMDIYDDYSNMDWVRSDIFDGYIADKMLDVLFDDTRHNDYYKFKMQKENEL
jgi:hypothetical protein